MESCMSHSVFEAPHTRLAIFLVSVLVIIYLIYLPGTYSPFQFDDHANLSGLHIENQQDFKQFVFGNNSGPTGRPVSMASFVINDSQWPGFAPDFKRTNLLLHLTTGLILIWFSYLLMAFFYQKQTAIVIASVLGLLWMTAPMHTSTVLYVVQRMTILASMFGLLSGVLYLKFRLALSEQCHPMIIMGLLAGAVASFVLALLSKESIVMLPLVLLVLEWTVLSKHVATIRWQQGLIYSVALAMAVGIVAYHLLHLNGILYSYEVRAFSAIDKVSLFPVALGSYGAQFFSIDSRLPSLFHDDFFRLYAGNYLLIVTGWIVLLLLLLVAVIARKRIPLFTLGVFWYVALHALEAGIIPVEPYFEHRNYLASVGLLIGLFGVLAFLGKQRFKLAWIIAAVLLVINIGFLVLSSVTWSNFTLLGYTWSVQHPQSLRSQRYFSHTLEVLGSPANARKAERYTADAFPESLGPFFNLIRYNCELGDSNIQVIKAFARRLEHKVFPRINAYAGVEALEKVVPKNLACLSREQQLDMFLEQLEILAEAPIFSRDRKIGARLHASISTGYVYAKKFEGAMRHLDLAIELQPVSSMYLDKGLLLMSAGLYDLAVEAFESALNLEARKETNSVDKREVEYLLKLAQMKLGQQN